MSANLPPKGWQGSYKTPEERLAALEVHVSNILDDVTKISDTVMEIRDLVLKGKGAKWAIITFVSFISSALAIGLHKLFPFWK